MPEKPITNYDPAKLERKVAYPLTSPNPKAIKRIERIQSTTTANRRYNTSLKPSKIEYSTGWYYQGNNPSCLPWALAGACLDFGLEPNPVFMAKILNLTFAEEGFTSGIGFDDLNEVGKNFSWVGLNMHVAKTSEALIQPVKPSDIRTAAAVASFLAGPIGGFGRGFVDKNVLEVNARLISKHLSSNGVIIQVIENSHFEKNKSLGCHAIGINGYRVDARGVMDIRIRDSRYGIFWVSLERLTEALFDYSSLFVSGPEQISSMSSRR